MVLGICIAWGLIGYCALAALMSRMDDGSGAGVLTVAAVLWGITGGAGALAGWALL